MSPEFTTRINWILDNLLPPIIRDPIVKLTIKIFFKSDANKYLSLKEQAYKMTDMDFQQLYETLNYDVLSRSTDLNKASIERILQNITGSQILDVGCGKQHLVNTIVERMGKNEVNVTGVDFSVVENNSHGANPCIVKGDIYDLPFEDESFDTVICTHTLEHVLDMEKAISELRRVARNRLIIIVPCQREYKYTFNFHVNFFPYPFSLLKLMKNPKGICQMVDLDLFYLEDK